MIAALPGHPALEGLGSQTRLTASTESHLARSLATARFAYLSNRLSSVRPIHWCDSLANHARPTEPLLFDGML
jgi:hypothetical protein